MLRRDDDTAGDGAVHAWRAEFYRRHESCGKCTPCSGEGTYWTRVCAAAAGHREAGQGVMSRPFATAERHRADRHQHLTAQSSAATLGDAPHPRSSPRVKYFREDTSSTSRRRGCPFDRPSQTAWADRPEVNA
ncbi:NADH-ubiquinone oxidoreductase-F iron-sulfur binding region domain-containing protein [Streptomyces echinatus]|uniref:NADH-ubiquinone oxidoreductase-F iron-sulfur binding region domain-containing protein n=1 Tax=Streptomyces echinatus TaxID=67293 RepID=UPI003CD085E0